MKTMLKLAALALGIAVVSSPLLLVAVLISQRTGA